MNKSHKLNTVFFAVLLFGFNQAVVADEIYQTVDENGQISFSNVAMNNTDLPVTQESVVQDVAYQWKDEAGINHFSDVLPVDTPIKEVHQININRLHDNVIEQKRYSLVEQADRMTEDRMQRENERLALKRAKEEEYRIAQELEVLRAEELIRKQGYGPEPFPTNSSLRSGFLGFIR